MEDLPETIDKCLKILDENMEILGNIEMKLDDERENELIPNLKLHQLHDMVEDISESSKIKRAENNLIRRQSGDF